MEALTKLIAEGLIVPLGLIAVYALLIKTPVVRRYDRYTRILMAGVTSYVLAKFIGYLWQPSHERPFEQLGVEPGASFLNNPGFPSDHALFATFLVLAVWYATRDKRITILLAAMAVLVGIGRVIALVHSPLDVIGGVMIAAIGAVWYVSPFEKTQRIRLAKKSKK